MRIWVQTMPGGRASSHPARSVADLWEMLDWFSRRWGSRMKVRPAIQVHVMSDTGESLLCFKRDGHCKRHSWRPTRRDAAHDTCRACGTQRKTSKSEQKRRVDRARRLDAQGKAAVRKILDGLIGDGFLDRDILKGGRDA